MYANNDEIIVDECNEECIFNKNGLCLEQWTIAKKNKENERKQ